MLSSCRLHSAPSTVPPALSGLFSPQTNRKHYRSTQSLGFSESNLNIGSLSDSRVMSQRQRDKTIVFFELEKFYL